MSAAHTGLAPWALLLGEHPDALDPAALLDRAPAARVAVLAARAQAGITTRVRRDTLLAGRLGLERVLLAVRGLDEPRSSDGRLALLGEEFRAYAASVGIAWVEVAPWPPPSEPGSAEGPLPSEGSALLAGRPRSATPSPAEPPPAADQYKAELLWLAGAPLIPGRRFSLASGALRTGAAVSRLEHRVDPDTLARVAARHLSRGELGSVTIALDQPLALPPHARRSPGATPVLIDADGERAAGVLIRFPLRRALNLHRQALAIDQRARSVLAGHRAAVVWFTGLSGAGKSTIANLVEQRLHAAGVRTYLLDGDNLRHGLNRDLGFTEADRIENVRRTAEVARLMVDAGLVVLVSLISPFAEQRQSARALFEPDEFCEVFVDAPLELAEARDPKGLYAKARRGELVNFTGIDSPYEPPARPELRIDTSRTPPEHGAQAVLAHLARIGVIALLIALALLLTAPGRATRSAGAASAPGHLRHWVDAWGAAPELPSSGNAGLRDQTIRELAIPSVPGRPGRFDHRRRRLGRRRRGPLDR
jgi:adenylyl-sulfate kinase